MHDIAEIAKLLALAGVAMTLACVGGSGPTGGGPTSSGGPGGQSGGNAGSAPGLAGIWTGTLMVHAVSTSSDGPPQEESGQRDAPFEFDAQGHPLFEAGPDRVPLTHVGQELKWLEGKTVVKATVQEFVLNDQGCRYVVTSLAEFFSATPPMPNFPNNSESRTRTGTMTVEFKRQGQGLDVSLISVVDLTVAIRAADGFSKSTFHTEIKGQGTLQKK